MTDGEKRLRILEKIPELIADGWQPTKVFYHLKKRNLLPVGTKKKEIDAFAIEEMNNQRRYADQPLMRKAVELNGAISRFQLRVQLAIGALDVTDPEDVRAGVQLLDGIQKNTDGRRAVWEEAFDMIDAAGGDSTELRATALELWPSQWREEPVLEPEEKVEEPSE